MTEFYWETRGAEGWSNDHGPHPTREAALEAGKTELGPDTKLQTGIREDCCAAQFVRVDVDQILESINEAAGEEVGEVAEDWPDLSREEQTKLEVLLEATVRKFFEEHNLEPTFWKVTETQDHP